MDKRTPSNQLVVVGSSAGGVEALSTLMTTIPADFPAPIVIAQHLDPLRPSHLAEILGSRGRLPVRTILERDALQSGHVYVVPADRHVEIADGHLTLRSNHVGRPKPSVDLLFRTAAQAYGDGVIAVILTGSGSDGAAGALEVKKAGGAVIVQNPATAAFPSMPRSLAPTAIDFAVNIEEIGPLVYDLLTNAVETEQPNESKALQSVLQLVHERSGLDFTSYKEPTIQ
jgi:two-component system, chemotaxis family, CheB/CheR fusion protein